MQSTFTEGFVNTRVRLQRLQDARFFSGWVGGFAGCHLSVKVPLGCNLKGGDMTFVTVNSATCSATFQAQVTSMVGNDLMLQVETTPKYGPPIEDVRYATDALSGSLIVGSRRIAMEVGDISDKGLGGHTDLEVKRGSTVSFEIESLYGKVGGTAEVRYCRADHARPGRFRIGCLIVEVGRIDQARWNRMLSTQME